ncbi:GIY-YIG nuclease family protein, partial [Candidatus Methylomirabilis sp.]|uniref:GIY-YIG nuclease family protein n=1 Tax=Candidatus Methylomirabilis sp. TaxID=2032687 RepID=UPI003C72E660
CGYENINHDFSTLETIFKSGRPDWKAALENVKGVYLIIDKYNGKKYVGSAYGGSGIWARWECYMGTGHGWNDELTKLIQQEGIDYARKNFRLSLLEYRPARTDDRVIIERENYWKEALLSCGAFGYNRN